MCWKKQLGWAMAVFCGMGLGWGESQRTTLSQLDVAVFNDAGVDPQIVREAEDRAAQVFRVAEIEVHWRNAHPEQTAASAEPASSEHGMLVSVRILPCSRDLAADILGLAFIGKGGRGQQADIFYDGIAKLSRSESLNAAVLLGAVMAHEVGHLLLGSKSHSATGIMQRHWHESDLKLAALGEFGFGTAQKVKMQRRISAIEQEMESVVGGSKTSDRVVRAEVDPGVD